MPEKFEKKKFVFNFRSLLGAMRVCAARLASIVFDCEEMVSKG